MKPVTVVVTVAAIIWATRAATEALTAALTASSPKAPAPSTARDADLEDHLRLRHPTGLITADNLLAHFAIQGVTDPRAAATRGLTRLALLGVIKRVGDAHSGVYTLLPAD